MSEIWYEAASWGARVEPHEVVKSTKETVWVKIGSHTRMRRVGNDFFRTWDEAKAELVRRATKRVADAELQVRFAQKGLAQIQALAPRPTTENG